MSIYLKHCPQLYCVDFDTHDLDGCELHDYLRGLDTARTQTRKGSHYYLYITDVPSGLNLTGSRQQRVCADGRFDVDLLYGNNVWEPVDREVHGELRTVAWEHVAHFFSIGAEPQPKRQRAADGAARPAAAAVSTAALPASTAACTCEPPRPRRRLRLVRAHRARVRVPPRPPLSPLAG